MNKMKLAYKTCIILSLLLLLTILLLMNSLPYSINWNIYIYQSENEYYFYDFNENKLNQNDIIEIKLEGNMKLQVTITEIESTDIFVGDLYLKKYFVQPEELKLQEGIYLVDKVYDSLLQYIVNKES